MKLIPYGRQSISEDDIKSVVDVLRSEYLTQGPAVEHFETHIKKLVGADYVIAVNSATSALHLACLALGISQGDLVWTSPVTFVATSNAVLYCGGEVDFVDIDPHTYNFSYEAFAEKLESAVKSGEIPKAIIPVHLCGQSPDMEKISKLCKIHGIKIIEDASHSIGAKYKNQFVGNCQFSDITVFSFHPVKIITTGEGGACLTNCQKLASKMSLLRSHGITRDQESFVNSNDGPWYYEQQELGYNYRMTDFQAALGSSQIQRIGEFIEKRHQIAEYYNNNLSTHYITPVQLAETYSSFHLYVIRTKLKNKSEHSKLFCFLREKGIGVNLHYIPVYKHPYYSKLGFKSNLCPVAEDYYETSFSLPMFPGLDDQSMNYVVKVLNDYASKN